MGILNKSSFTCSSIKEYKFEEMLKRSYRIFHTLFEHLRVNLIFCLLHIAPQIFLFFFTEDDSNLTCLTKDVPTLKWYQFWQSPPKTLTRLTIKAATGLEKQEIFGSKFTYSLPPGFGKKLIYFCLVLWFP